MADVKSPSTYKAFLLRCWLDGQAWRYSLEEVGSSMRQGFATLDELVLFLLILSLSRRQ